MFFDAVSFDCGGGFDVIGTTVCVFKPGEERDGVGRLRDVKC